jgi:CRP-like cAMP-binding protein
LLADLDEDLGRLRGLELGRLVLDPAELLRKVPVFMGLSEEEFARVSRHLRQNTVPAGETFIHQGDTDGALYLIARGTVDVYLREDGREVVLNVLNPGDFVGETGFLTGAPRNAHCRAVTPCAVYELRRSDVDKFRAACPGLNDALAKAARRRTVDVCLLDDHGLAGDGGGVEGSS